jgi:hypothetical protein
MHGQQNVKFINIYFHRKTNKRFKITTLLWRLVKRSGLLWNTAVFYNSPLLPTAVSHTHFYP